MTHNSQSQVRVALLLASSFVAGVLGSSLLISRMETWADKPIPQTDQSLVAESP